MENLPQIQSPPGEYIIEFPSPLIPKYQPVVMLPTVQKTKTLLHFHSRRAVKNLRTIATSSISTYELNVQIKRLITSNKLNDARTLFDNMPYRDEISWTTIMNGYLQAHDPAESLSLFSKLHSTSAVSPDQFILSLVLKACAAYRSFLSVGESIHAFCTKYGAFPTWVYVSTALIDLYSRNVGSSLKALTVFKEMPVKNAVSWTAAITALVRVGNYHHALRCFAEMRRMDVYSDSHTYAIVFKACTDANLLRRGKEVHSHAIKMGIDSGSFVSNSLATMYSKCGELDQAIMLFQKLQYKDVVSWTSVISTYVQMGREFDAIHAFLCMKNEGVSPNEYTYGAVVSACTGLTEIALGEQLHAQVIHNGIVAARNVANSFVTFYARIGYINSADLVFENISPKDIVSWSAIISAYAQEGTTDISFSLFCQMRRSGIFATEFQLASLLSACASSAILDSGRQVHALMISVGVESDHKTNSALINMYSKCGMIDEACRAFSGLKSNNVVSWTAMINGYADHGRSKEAIDTFNSMVSNGLVPDHVAYIGVLSACSHVGLVDFGLNFFNMMKEVHKLQPWKEHYGCVVDLLGRAGRLKEAEKMMNEMPEKPDEVLWTTMLRACTVHGDLELGQKAAERVLEITPECAGAHVALSNIYSAKGKWGNSARMRMEMRGKGVRKETGWSWIGIGDGSVCIFTAGDRLHERGDDIYDILGLFYFEAKVDEIQGTGDEFYLF